MKYVRSRATPYGIAALFLFILGISVVAGGVPVTRAGMKIALICSGSITDGGWNQQGRDAIIRVGKEMHAHVSVVERVSPVRAVNVMRDYAMEHYSLVIGHGYEFLIPATEAAAEGEGTRFAVSGAGKAEPNIATLDFNISEPSYQLGVLAAMLSKTGKLGFIGGEAIPPVVAGYRGFVAGARSVNPHITVAQAYTSWDQPALSKSQTEAFIQQGIDVIYQNVDAADRGVFEAVKAADKNLGPDGHPVYVFGSNRNQNNNSTCGPYTPASVVIRLGRAFLQIAREVEHHHFQPGVIRENMRNHVCVLVLNPKLKGTVITRAMRVAVATAGRELLAGKIHIPTR